MTTKEYITKYISLKLQSGEWTNGQKIASENQLAIKFNCSRLSARQALQPFIYSGVLEASRGKGYIVSDEIDEIALTSFTKQQKIDNSKLEIVEINDEIRNEMGLEEFHNLIFFKKKYYKKNRIVAIQLTALNKDLFFEFNPEEFRDSITKSLSNQGVVIRKNRIEINFTNSPVLKKEAKDLGWNNEYIIHNVKSWSSNGEIIEKTIRVVKKEDFNLKYMKLRF